MKGYPNAPALIPHSERTELCAWGAASRLPSKAKFAPQALCNQLLLPPFCHQVSRSLPHITEEHAGVTQSVTLSIEAFTSYQWLYYTTLEVPQVPSSHWRRTQEIIKIPPHKGISKAVTFVMLCRDAKFLCQSYVACVLETKISCLQHLVKGNNTKK